MGALLPVILAVLPGLISAAEAAFAKKGSGTDKMNAVLQALQAYLENLYAAKQQPDNSPASVPGADSLTGVIETLLSQMKANDTLTPKPAASPTLYLVSGTVTQLKTAA
jgi:transglutaminase/protease-like cytokinesis protein 3